ncbi:MAG: hypothetical protein A2Z21_08075 [Candidatus Fraserbacteria bacterium RBG_16_55_9]|uniref:Regulatory protein RecX n=1 Tax=Fraserbacteria sp. (strain RBG_16_55_9) TaxID=1817864 RepID=A0A1F5UNK5_FRAXR|nr:MAG: hypothetical protein A2Z21_08075 [Candidatus Fraserbacteria bacterium RBG_16_55_9]
MKKLQRDKGRNLLNDELAQAREHILRLLSFRPRSIHETRSRLKRAGYPSSAIQQVIQEAEERGWLDDASFAKLWVQDRLATKPKGRAQLKSELRAKGVTDELIEQALNEVEIDERQIIQQLIEQQKTRYRGDDRIARERKLYAYLRRRGFSPEAIRRALRQTI